MRVNPVVAGGGTAAEGSDPVLAGLTHEMCFIPCGGRAGSLLYAAGMEWPSVSRSGWCCSKGGQGK